MEIQELDLHMPVSIHINVGVRTAEKPGAAAGASKMAAGVLVECKTDHSDAKADQGAP